MANKSTKREVINMMLNVPTIVENELFANFLNHELELLDKKSENKKPTKTQLENMETKEIILEVLNTGFVGTCTELSKADSRLNGLSTSKISALLKQLIVDGSVKREISGKSAIFSIATK